MRIRRKKNLDERLSLVRQVVIRSDRDIPNVNEAIKNKKYFDYQVMFGNDNPVELEIGCGKGAFVCGMAKLNPIVNYIAVELLESISVMAGERVLDAGVTNVRVFNGKAEYLPRYIKDQSIDNIYLNFSPPFPQDRFENRRLTSDRYLPSYKAFLKDGGYVYQKTDDKGLFDYSLRKFREYGFEVEDITTLIGSGELANVETEYERKFREQNMPLYALKAKKI